MRNYADGRAAKLKLMREEFIARKSLLITISTVLTILAFLTLACGEIISIFFIASAVVAWKHSFDWIKKNNRL